MIGKDNVTRKDNKVVTETKTTTIMVAMVATTTTMLLMVVMVAIMDLHKEDITMVTIIWAITIITTIKTNIILLKRIMIESQFPLLILNLKIQKKPKKENLLHKLPKLKS